MCYDISFKSKVGDLSDYFPDMKFDDQIEIDFNQSVHIIGHSYQEIPIVYTNKQDNLPHCRLMEWGCIPSWVKDEKAFQRQRATMLNARSERVLDDPKSTWYKIRNNRCVIPMSAFYEHREVPGLKKKVPYHISLKNEKLFFVAALATSVSLNNAEGIPLKRRTVTLITRAANNVMQQIHNGGDNAHRMPLILTEDYYKLWLMPEITNDDYKAVLDFELPSAAMEYYTVDTIRSPKQRADGLSKDALFEWNIPEITV